MRHQAPRRAAVALLTAAALLAVARGAAPSLPGFRTVRIASQGRGAYLLVPPGAKPGAATLPLLVLLHGAGKGADGAVRDVLTPQDASMLALRRALVLLPESRGATWCARPSSAARRAWLQRRACVQRRGR